MAQDPTTLFNILNTLCNTNNRVETNTDQINTLNRKMDDVMSVLLEMKAGSPSVEVNPQTASLAAPPVPQTDKQYRAKLKELLDTIWPPTLNDNSSEGRYAFFIQAAGVVSAK
ncbi:hypothetical protein [Absidia glauca]|uniref:Uncharacterized protein n=1 Tax=Absidia glauca TaxID=4829 RepID=A0A163J010_ABSGL|nr:hypothetical protein [Absidia glauca]